MVNITVTYLIAMSDNLTAVITECTFHKVIVEITKNCFNMVVLTCLYVGITELVITPAESCCGIVFGHTEFNVVTSVVETACNVNTAVTVGVENVLVLINE